MLGISLEIDSFTSPENEIGTSKGVPIAILRTLFENVNHVGQE